MKIIQHKFVNAIPEKLKDGTLYISLKYCTAMHKCACGCGNEVVTPISPTDWKLTFDGMTVSLFPSIGNWAFPCQSHYWITNNKIEHSGKWTKKEIISARKKDKKSKDIFYKQRSVDNK